jgi:asparagine synthase (glutamine-hydrolysing)
VLATVLELGPEAVGSIEGELAFAIVDTATLEVTFGRDFFGLYPIYYSELTPRGVAFASEYKALLCLPEVDATVDPEMLQCLHDWKKMPAGRTLLTSVRTPPPGCIHTSSSDGRSQTRSVSPTLVIDEGAIIHSESTAAARLRDELRATMERQAGDLDPIGLALSGGIDSVALAFLLREMYPRRAIHTFSAGHGPDDPELVRAKEASSRIQSIHHEVIVSPAELGSTLTSMVWHLEDPIARTEAAQLFEIGRHARGHVPAVVVGHGADSLFAGMPRHRLLWLISRLWPVRASLADLYDQTQYGTRPNHLLARAASRIYFDRKLGVAPRVIGIDHPPPPPPLPPPGPEFVNRVLAEHFQEAQGTDAPKYERNFAAWGVSFRGAYCDVGLARFAFTISDRLKIRATERKIVLRRALRPVVPQSLLVTPKAPMRIRADDAFIAMLDRLAKSLLSETAVRDRGMFRYEDVAAAITGARTRPASYERIMRLWTLLLTELWAQAFVDNRGTEVHAEREMTDREPVTSARH